jgi:small GTP-binding protein
VLDLLRSTEMPEATIAQVEEVVDHLDELFLVVVVGEFNAGKSTVLNALFGDAVLPEGPVPTTDKITILRYGDEPLTRQRTEYVNERRLPVDLLRHLTLVDTPGTNSIVQEHQKITEDFIPRSDLVLFVTSYDRPLTESERQFLSYIREDWGREIVFVVNKADAAASESDLQQVIEYVKTNCRDLLDVDPDVFPVSAKQALRAKDGEETDDALWERSRFAPLETFFSERLAGPERVSMKLKAPLQTAERLVGRVDTRLSQRERVLEHDQATLDQLRKQLEEARSALADGYDPHLREVETVFRDIRRRGVQFLNDTIRVRRIGLLRDRERFRQQFEEQVVSETTRQVEQVVTDAVDDLLTEAMDLQQNLFRTFADRVQETRREGRFAADRGFSYDRREVFSSIMDDAEREIHSHDLEREVQRIVENVYNDANLVVGAGVGAATAGGLGIVLLVASALDAVGGFGLATGTAAALYGATVLPRQRRKAVDEFTERIETLEGNIQDALRERLDDEIDAALDRVWDTVEPFADFVTQEDESLGAARSSLDEIESELVELQNAVDRDAGASESP